MITRIQFRFLYFVPRLFLSLALFHANPIFALNISWVGNSAAWTTASNWSSNTVPTASDDVVAGLGAFTPVLSAGNGFASSLQVSSSLNIINGCTLTVSGLTVPNAGGSGVGINMSGGGKLKTSQINVAGVGGIDLNGGTLEVDNFSNGSGSIDIYVGSSGGTLGVASILSNQVDWISSNTKIDIFLSKLNLDAGSDGLTRRMNGVISGFTTNASSIRVEKLGTNTLILTNTNTYPGVTLISAGTLQLGNGGTTGMVPGNIINNSNLAFNRSDVTLTYANAISGSGNVTQSGSGTLIFTGANTHTGNTIVSSGVLNIGGGSATGSVTGPIVDNAALVFDRSNDLIYAGQISGAGTMTKQGAGKLTLTANSTSYTGTTTIGTGTLQLGDGASVGMVAGPIINNATLVFKEPSTSTYANVISGNGSVEQQGPGTLILTNTNTYPGVTLISAGTLQLGNGGITGMVSGNITNNSNLVFNRSDATLTYANSIIGSGNVTQAGSGTLIFTGANTYTGNTIVSSGVLNIGGGGTTGSVIGPIVDNAALVFDRSNDVIYAGQISGAGTMTKQGAGKLTLTANSTSYTGTTTISTGTLQLGDGASVGMVAGPIINNANLVFKEPSTSTYASVISGSGSVEQQGPGTLIFTNANTYNSTLISGGTLQLGNGVSVGTVASDIVDNAALVFNEPSDVTYAGIISGTGTLSQVGPGTLILNGVNTYTGGTTVNGGALRLGDALHPTATVAGDLTVNMAGTLQGYGKVLGNVINSGGIVSPGASIGTITIGGNYTQSPTGTYVAQVDSAGNSDLLVVGGVATLNGTIGVSAINDGFLDGYPYTIITAAGGVTGQFSNTDVDNIFYQGFLKGEVRYFPNMVQFTVAYDPDEILAAVETPNQEAVANYLLNTGSTTAIQSLISSLTTNEQLRLALDQISGATYTNQSLVLARMGNWFSGELSDRFDAFPSCNQGSRDLSAGEGDVRACDARSQWWVAGHASRDRVTAGDASGFNVDNSDGALGYEMSLNPLTKVGVGAAYNHFSGNATVNEMGQMSGDLYQVGLYGRYRRGNWLIGAAVDAGKTNDVKVSRQIDGAKGVVSTAGSYRADFYTEQARLSYDLTAQQVFRVSPFVGVIGQQLNRNSFTETTETGFELSVDSTNYRSTRSQLGAMFELSTRTWVKPFVSVDWEHEFSDEQTTFNASVVGVGGQFHIQSDQTGRDAALLKAGAVLLRGNHWNVAALYEGWFNGTCQQNGGTLQANLILG